VVAARPRVVYETEIQGGDPALGGDGLVYVELALEVRGPRGPRRGIAHALDGVGYVGCGIEGMVDLG
jgi:hypothetical protein